jgi:hypothetical protein
MIKSFHLSQSNRINIKLLYRVSFFVDTQALAIAINPNVTPFFQL